MKTPSLLLAAALLFWGWQTGLLYLAFFMIPVIEGARFAKSKWELSLSDFNRISDLCTILLVGVVIFVLFTYPNAIIMLTVKWLPVITFPLLAAQEYSTVGKVDIRALFMLARRKETSSKKLPVFINLCYPYFVLCIFSAASANIRTDGFYLCLFMLFVWALIVVRSRRYHLGLWIFLLLIAGVIGYFGHIGLNRMQNFVMNWTTDFFLSDADPFKSTTAIGEIGKVKQSNRIVFRIIPNTKFQSKILMREACYNRYSSSIWFASTSFFEKIKSQKNGTSWQLLPDKKPSEHITVASYLKGGKGILKLPIGA